MTINERISGYDDIMEDMKPNLRELAKKKDKH